MCSPCLNCLCDGSNLIHLASFCKSNCPHAFLNAPAYISLHHFTTHAWSWKKSGNAFDTKKWDATAGATYSAKAGEMLQVLSGPTVFWACRSSLQQQCVAGTNLQGLQFRRKDSRTIVVAKAMLGRRYDFLKMKRYEEVWRGMKRYEEHAFLLFSLARFPKNLTCHSLLDACWVRHQQVIPHDLNALTHLPPSEATGDGSEMIWTYRYWMVLMPCTNFLSCGLHVLHIVTMSTQMSAFVASTMYSNDLGGLIRFGDTKTLPYWMSRDWPGATCRVQQVNACLAHEVLVSIPVVLVEGILQLLNAVSCEGFQALRDEICLLKYVEMTISFFSALVIISPARSSMETKGYLSSHAL